MRKIIAMTVLMTVLASGALFAESRIQVNYNGESKVFLMQRTVAATDEAYFQGIYDAYAAIQEGKKLYQIDEMIANKKLDGNQKASYSNAVDDFMNQYSFADRGTWKDIYPLYKAALSGTRNYKNAEDVVYFGEARFYLTNVT